MVRAAAGGTAGAVGSVALTAKGAPSARPDVVLGEDLNRDFRTALQEVRSHVTIINKLIDVLQEQHENIAVSYPSVPTHCQGPKVKLDEALPLSPAHSLNLPAGDVKKIAVCEAASQSSSMREPFENDSQDPFSAEDRMQLCIEENSLDGVREMLMSGFNPNRCMQDRDVRGLALVSCTPLAIAVIHQRSNIVRLLIASQADLNTHYSFLAGADQMKWSGPVIQALSPSGNLAFMQELVNLQADVHAESSNGATLLWQAAYFGHSEVIKFLLDKGVDKECQATNQDNAALAHTPLHIAAKTGNYCAVQSLLDAKASFHVHDGLQVSPLDDAVAGGHADIVQLLISRHADVFQTDPLSVEMPEHVRCVDNVFASNNHALVAAVAKGLAHIPRPAIQRKDLIRFLNTPGDSPLHIWDAIFRATPLRHWEPNGSKLRRVITHTAYMSPAVGMTTALGPQSGHVAGCFKKKSIMNRSFDLFRTRITRETKHHSRDLHVPVTFYSCILPYVQEDLQVILAMANCEQERVFEVPGCRAILQLMWAHERAAARFRMVMAFVEVINLVVVNVILNTYTQFREPQVKEYFLRVALVVALVVWLVATFIEMLQAIGYCSHGLTRQYILNKRHGFDVLVLALTGLVIGWTWLEGERAPDAPEYRISLGFVVGLKWGRLLISLRQFKSVAIRILPILDTMWDLGPFLFVLSVYFIGAVNMLYAMGQHTIEDAFLIIYRLVVLGDVNLFELEGQTMTLKSVDGGATLEQISNQRTQYREVVRIMMLVISFVMGVSMMNLFVAMLCLSYSEAAVRAPMAFERSRAHMVLDDYAARKGLIWIVKWFDWVSHRHNVSHSDDMSTTNSTVSSQRPEHSVQSLWELLRRSNQLEDDENCTAFVWFSLPKIKL